jgi:hypothetical protein
MSRIALVVLACAALAGCWADGERPEPRAGTDAASTESEVQVTTEPAVEPVTLVPMPPQALRRCRRFPELAELCPLEIPEGRFGPGSGAYQAFSCARCPQPAAWTFGLSEGAENPRRPERNRPPELVHLVVTAAPPLRTDLPRQRELRDGLLEERRRKLVFLGRANWGGHEGVLILAPPYPLGGVQSNHLIFSWAGGSKAVSLHGWEPFTEVPDVLQAVVESIPASR